MEGKLNEHRDSACPYNFRKAFYTDMFRSVTNLHFSKSVKKLHSYNTASQVLRLCDCVCLYIDEIEELRKKEKELGIEPDWEIDAFMKASALRGKEHSIMTDYILRMLGLEVSLYSPHGHAADK